MSPVPVFSSVLFHSDRTAAHKDVCFRQVDEGFICSQPTKNMAVTYSECCCHYGHGWGPECNTCPPRDSGERATVTYSSYRWLMTPTSAFFSSYKQFGPLYSDMFSRLCEMHLETESDGEPDFLPAFSNYNPGKHRLHLWLYIWSQTLTHHRSICIRPTWVLACLLFLLRGTLKATVRRRIRTSAAVQTAAVFALILVPCVNVTKDLGWTTPAPVV